MRTEHHILDHDLYLIAIRRYVASGLSGLSCLSGLFGLSGPLNSFVQQKNQATR